MTHSMKKENHPVGQKELIKVVFAAILAALALIVGYVEIVWPLAPWLKLDFSEVVVLISFILLGFRHTVGVIVVRSVIRWLVTTNSTNTPFPFFGETIAIVASISLVVIYLLVSKILKVDNKPKSKETERVKSPYHLAKNGPVKVIAKEIGLIVIVTILMALFMVVFNFLVVTPSFLSAGEHPFFLSFLRAGGNPRMGGGNIVSYAIAITTFYAPFNLLKFASCLIIFTMMKKPILSTIDLRS